MSGQAQQDLRGSACVSRTTARAARTAPAGGPAQGKQGGAANEPPGGHGGRAPPDPIPTSEVKPPRADDSVDPHAKVGHCQAPKPKPPCRKAWGFFCAMLPLNNCLDPAKPVKRAAAMMRDSKNLDIAAYFPEY